MAVLAVFQQVNSSWMTVFLKWELSQLILSAQSRPEWKDKRGMMLMPLLCLTRCKVSKIHSRHNRSKQRNRLPGKKLGNPGKRLLKLMMMPLERVPKRKINQKPNQALSRKLSRELNRRQNLHRIVLNLQLLPVRKIQNLQVR